MRPGKTKYAIAPRRVGTLHLEVKLLVLHRTDRRRINRQQIPVRVLVSSDMRVLGYVKNLRIRNVKEQERRTFRTVFQNKTPAREQDRHGSQDKQQVKDAVDESFTVVSHVLYHF